MKLLICGKGGSGKSTVSVLMARAFQRMGKRVLLVDADESNLGLHRLAGSPSAETLLEALGGKAGLRSRKQAAFPSTTCPAFYETAFTWEDIPERCVPDARGIRLLKIGKIKTFGEGCACPMGRLFRMLFSALALADNDLVIVDAAAGVEHFGRGLDGQCDQILCVVDPSYESIMMARRVTELAREANLPVALVLNRTTPDVEKELTAALDGTDIIGCLPDSRVIFRNNLQGKPLDTDPPELVSICDAILESGT